MVVCTLLATTLVLPNVPAESGMRLLPETLDIATLMFIAALLGWMPVPLDVSIWQSLWAKAKSRNAGRERSAREVRFDFNLGYLGTMVLALCFVCLGAGLMNAAGILPVSGSVAFSAQLINLYQDVFGNIAGPIVGLAALAVVYSSLLAVMDGFPRTLATLHRRWRQISEDDDTFEIKETGLFYLTVLATMIIAAAITYRYFVTSLTGLVDVAATVAFVTAPLIALLNHNAITNDNVLPDYRPSPAFRLFSISSILILTGFATGYLYLRFWLI